MPITPGCFAIVALQCGSVIVVVVIMMVVVVILMVIVVSGEQMQ